MKLEEIVPPLELCKKIPKGEFVDSSLVYWGIFLILRRSADKIVTNEKLFPAPILEEIMAEMPYCRVYKKTKGLFIAVHEKIRIADTNGATAALKLWLKLKGIEYEKE